MKGTKCSKTLLSLDVAIIFLGIIVFLVSLVVSTVMFKESYRFLSIIVNLISVMITFFGVNTLCDDIFS